MLNGPKPRIDLQERLFPGDKMWPIGSNEFVKLWCNVANVMGLDSHSQHRQQNQVSKQQRIFCLVIEHVLLPG